MKLRLEIEDCIALCYAAVVGALYAAAYFQDDPVVRRDGPIFYYFLFPFLLVVLKEVFCYLFSEDMKISRFYIIFRDWFPFLLILSMYYSMYDGLNHFIVRTDQDALLASWDLHLFGCQPSAKLQDLVNVPYLTDWLSFCYFSFIFIPPLTAGYFYLKGMRLAFRMSMLGLVIIEFIGCFGYLALPAVGPLYAYKEWYTQPLYGSVLTDSVAYLHNLARLPRDCFPSLHTGITALFYFFLWRYARVFFFLSTPIICSLWFSCMFLRFHYLVDVLAGFLLAVLIFLFEISYLEGYLRRRDSSL
ncbi:MAG: phosphatase PAP2 family protein [Candidatus Wallbacteria bacterium]|nr:phosphatase PAP2 family protein [Candidatus Wallbacteria bacterium]